MSVLAEQTSSFALDRVAPQLDPLLGISIEVIRHLREEMSKPPFTAPRRFFIILHAERMTTEAANAFLKSLEEPQHQTTSVLVSSTPSLLPDTIRSRCRLVRFPAVPAVEIQTWLVARRHVKRAEAAAAAEVANGAPGQALRYLDEPHEYLASPIVEFFADGEASESLIGATIESLAGTPLTTIVNSFLLLFNRALRHKRNHALVSGEVNDPAITRASSLSEDYLRRAIGYLFERLGEARIHTNRRLFLYTLLASLRRSS